MIRLRNVYNEYEQAGFTVEPEDILFLYELLRERPQEANISHRALPAFNDHVAFVRSRPYQHWYIVEAEAKHYASGQAPKEESVRVGAVLATRQNEIGIAIKREHQRCGFAAQAITQFMLDHRPLPAVPSQRVGEWLANIAPGNAPSHALFDRLGFKQVQTTYQHP